jgi:hypothetical protein
MPDSLAKRDGFELSGDFVNRQQVIRKRSKSSKMVAAKLARETPESHNGYVVQPGAGRGRRTFGKALFSSRFSLLP